MNPFPVFLAWGLALAEPVGAIADGGEVFEGPVLRDPLGARSDNYFNVGVALQPFSNRLDNVDFLFGVPVELRLGPFAPHLALLVDPSIDGYEESLFVASAGFRGYFELGDRELSVGVALHTELRLADHFWLAVATPLELGAVLWEKPSWRLQLFAGAQRAFAGNLIDNFLVDPNGFHDESAVEHLHQARDEKPWRGFIRLVFARRID